MSLRNISGRWLTTFTNPEPIALNYFGHTVAAVGKERVFVGAASRSSQALKARMTALEQFINGRAAI